MSVEQLDVLSELVEEYSDQMLHVTTRQDIQLHWIRIADVPRIWQRFWEVGLTTVQACGDSARNVCACPVSGIDAQEVVDAYPVAQAISAFFTGNREYANLPRKFKIAVTGCLEDCARVEINDIGLWPARHDDGTASAWRRTLTSSSGPTRRSSSAAGWPRCSASWATARTAAWPACATWPRNWAPKDSGPPWTSAPASPSNPPALN
jgi:NAD(P)H-nitrite reductase large subunit